MNTERTTSFLMANLGSELIRFFALQRQKDNERARASADRAFRIMNQLLEHKDIGNGRREVALLKELTDDALLPSPLYRVTEAELNSYFMPFASRVLAV